MLVPLWKTFAHFQLPAIIDSLMLAAGWLAGWLVGCLAGWLLHASLLFMISMDFDEFFEDVVSWVLGGAKGQAAAPIGTFARFQLSAIIDSLKLAAAGLPACFSWIEIDFDEFS